MSKKLPSVNVREVRRFDVHDAVGRVRVGSSRGTDRLSGRTDVVGDRDRLAVIAHVEVLVDVQHRALSSARSNPVNRLSSQNEARTRARTRQRWAALLHDIGKPATRKHEADGGVSFHHHEVVGAKMARKRLRALKYSKQMVDDISQLVYLHLRFHGYGGAAGPTRRCAAMSPMPDRCCRSCTSWFARLHHPQQAASRPAQADYDDLEQRIAELAAKEDLQRVRPDLDGNEIMQLLGIPPGPQVGEAWRYLKELRLDGGHGPTRKRRLN